MVARKTEGEYKRNQEKIKKNLFRRSQTKEEIRANYISDQQEHQLDSRKSEKSHDKKPKTSTNDQNGINNSKERNQLAEEGNIT